MTAKPSLHEIAAMPYPQSEHAMREHYDPQWGKPEPEGELRRYRVEVSYTFTGQDTWTTEVNAHSPEEAEELAGDEFDKADLDLPWDADVRDADFEVDDIGPPVPASAMSAFGQDRLRGLEAKPASAVGEAETPKTSSPLNHRQD